MSVSMGGGPQVNKFEQVSNDGHQVSLVEGVAGQRGGPMSNVQGTRTAATVRGLYSEVQCIMGNGHMDPCLWTD